MMKSNPPLTRREFLKTGGAVSTAVVAAATLSTPHFHAAGSDKVRVALVGCGGRGTGAARDCLHGDAGAELVAFADLFKDKTDAALQSLKKDFGPRVSATPDTCFNGFDSIHQVLAMSEVQSVILATPPGFRPETVRAAIEAGKHVFMEKPGAVDPVGVRSLIETAELAKRKRLSIVVGTQQRRQPQYQEVIRRIQDGEIGEIRGGQAYWNWGFTDWHFHHRKPEWSDVEWQIRCWPYFTWLSGDHIVEQHLHNMDVINWALGGPPISAMGFGGRQARTSPEYGNIYDHFVIEFVYPGDIRVMSMASQIKGSNVRVGERVVGTRGATWTSRQGARIEGAKPWQYQGRPPQGLEQEHADLLRSIREGQPINECRRLAESTLTVIIGRLAAYSGQLVKFDWALNRSQLDLHPKGPLKLGPLPVAPVPIPGQYELS